MMLFLLFLDELEDIMTHFHLEAKAKFNIDRIVTARVGDLFVEEVSAPFEIREVEGMERLFDVSRRRDIVLTLPETQKETEKAEKREDGGGIVGAAPLVVPQNRETGARSPPVVQQNHDVSAKSLPALQAQNPMAANRAVPGPTKSITGKGGK